MPIEPLTRLWAFKNGSDHTREQVLFLLSPECKDAPLGLDYSPGLECMMPPSAKMVVAVR